MFKQMLVNAFKLAVQEIRRNLLRSFLTTLGIIIGVAAVITMVTLGRGATLQVTEQVASLGSNLLMVNRGQGFGHGRSRQDAPSFELSDVEAVRSEIRSEIRRNLLRSFLTTLGIIIGVAAVITMVTLGRGATLQVTEQVASLGSNLLMVNRGQGFGHGRSRQDAPSFELSDVEAVRSEIARSEEHTS